nr:hypothetical protein [uncultured Campylobacter sp.]
MSKKDAVNKDIDLAAKLLYFFLISFFGLCAFINADKLSLIQFVVLSVAGMVLCLCEFVCVKKYLKYRKELEQL